MAGGFHVSDFPKLNLDACNVSGLWNACRIEYVICEEMAQLRIGKDENDPYKFSSCIINLLQAIGKAGRDALACAGFDLKRHDYNGAAVRLT